jgi:hypothetical protein
VVAVLGTLDSFADCKVPYLNLKAPTIL